MGIIYVGKAKKKPIITRQRHGGGIIRIDSETCDILEEIIRELNVEMHVSVLASTLIKHAANDNVIKEGE